jgi:asparagine synthase (glutamine-hydrolysing)
VDVGVGFNRLSILDLTEAGRQPMLSADGGVLVVFNGEIYNAFDYVAELTASGCRFRGHSDTEVLLAMYQQWGIEGLLARVNGMFAFALLDIRRGLVYLARDHVGIKPLYVYQGGGLLLFASEMKSFLAHPAFRAELKTEALDEFLLFRSLADRTLFDSVAMVPSGTYWSIEGEAVSEKRYWTAPDRKRSTSGTSLEVLTRETGTRLREAVRSQLISEVRLGCQLSGGVDSSLVSYYATGESKGRLDAFSVVFEDEDYSEDVWMRQATKACAVAGHMFVLNASYFQENIERATWHLEDPLTHPSSLGILLLAEKASRFVTVLLSGEGADELFGGYTRHLDAVLRPRLRSVLPLLSALPLVGRHARAHFEHGGDSDAEDFVLASSVIDPVVAKSLYPSFDRGRALRARRAHFDSVTGSGLERGLKYELRTYLEPLLIRQDKMTMASSVENRVPFLDKAFVEFVFGDLPDEALVRPPLPDLWNFRRSNKIIPKRLAAGVFGDDFAYRKKLGFGIPLAEFLTGPGFDERFRDDILPSIRSRGLLDAGTMSRAWDSWKRSPGRAGGLQEVIWSGITLEVFLRLFMDGKHGKETLAS